MHHYTMVSQQIIKINRVKTKNEVKAKNMAHLLLIIINSFKRKFTMDSIIKERVRVISKKATANETR